MKRLVASTVVESPRERVWKLYSDVPGTVDWLPFVEEVLYVSGPAGLGQVYRERTRFMGVSDVSTWRVVEWDAPRRQIHRSRGKLMETDLVVELESAGERTRVRQEAVLRSSMPGMLGRLHEALYGVVARSGLKQAVVAAKVRMEHGDIPGLSRRPGGGGGLGV
jgi:hypothetical protein